MTETDLKSSEKLPEGVHTDNEVPTFRIIHLILFMVGLAIFIAIEETSMRLANRNEGEVANNMLERTTVEWGYSTLTFGVPFGLAGCWILTRLKLGRNFKSQPGHCLLPLGLLAFSSPVLVRLAIALAGPNSAIGAWVFYIQIVVLVCIAIWFSVCAFVFWRQRPWRYVFVFCIGSWIMQIGQLVLFATLLDRSGPFDPMVYLEIFLTLKYAVNLAALGFFLVAIYLDRKEKVSRDWIHFASCIHAALLLSPFALYLYDLSGTFIWTVD